jgi:hypothetical protein
LVCQHCKGKQKVHVAARPGIAQMDERFVRCVECKRDFSVMVPDRIVDGPFPA